VWNFHPSINFDDTVSKDNSRRPLTSSPNAISPINFVILKITNAKSEQSRGLAEYE
jgi:hypothetical protein